MHFLKWLLLTVYFSKCIFFYMDSFRSFMALGRKIEVKKIHIHINTYVVPFLSGFSFKNI